MRAKGRTSFLLFLLLSMSSGRPSGQQDPQLLSYQQRIIHDLGTNDEDMEINPEQNSTNVNGTDVLAVYGQYMANVRRRREAQRAQSGRKERRENPGVKSILIINGTRKEIEENKSQEMKMIYEFPLQLEEVRVNKAVFLGGPNCRLLNDRNQLLRREDENDVTELVVRWLKQTTTSLFTLDVICSRSPPTISLRLTTTRNSQRQKRSPDLLNRLSKWRTKQQKCEETERGEKLRHGVACCRRKLRIEMKDLGVLTNSIIEPQWFDAYMCEGKCTARSGGFATNHAVFQHLIHKKRGGDVVPRPCCSPTSFSELDIIYQVPKTRKISVAVIKNAIVEGCSCS